MLILSLPLLAACKKDDDKVTPQPQPSTAYGAAVTVGGGTARSFVVSDAAGNPTEIGVRLIETVLTGLPAMPAYGTMYDLALPATASKMPFDHVSFDWNPNGHEPNPIYGVPHFDAHFYMQPMAAQHAITPGDPKGDILPDSTHLPAVYYSFSPNKMPGTTVPMMGRHWVDPTSPEFSPAGFSSTFIYGSYDGKVTFMEPMFTKAMLTNSVNVTKEIKQPLVYEAPGKYYPTKYNIRYDAAAKEYIISLSDMIKR